jgi:Ca2+-binding EF-hand superfamily protein
MNKVILAALIGLGFSSAIYAQQTSAPPAAQAKKYDFKKIDADGDGKISRNEAKKYGITDGEFKVYDKDNSGFITLNEVSKEAWSI